MRTNGGINVAVRVEGDAPGNVEIPLDHLWGAETERSRHNFAMGVDRFIGAVP